MFSPLIQMGWPVRPLSPRAGRHGRPGDVSQPCTCQDQPITWVREVAGLSLRPYGPHSRGRGRWPDQARHTQARAAGQMPRTVLPHRVARARGPPVRGTEAAHKSGQLRWKNHLRYLWIVNDHVRAGGNLQDCCVHLIRTRPDDGKAGPAACPWLPVGRNGPWTARVVLQRRSPLPRG
jgi:hypothetical protein